MKTGKHKTFRLRHGASVREFSNVTVSKVPDPDRDDRYELTGTEHKVEADNTDSTTVVDVEVTVGFFAENALTD